MRTPHQNLTESFPELKPAFQHLKIHDLHFQQLLKQYEEVDNQINHIDNGGNAVEPMHFEHLKKTRVLLKDQLYQYMLKYQASL